MIFIELLQTYFRARHKACPSPSSNASKSDLIPIDWLIHKVYEIGVTFIF